MKFANLLSMAGIALATGLMGTGCRSCGTCGCDGARTMGDVVAKDEPVFVLCRFDLQPGKAGEYADAVRKVTDAVRNEKGCRFYSLVGDAETDMKGQMKFGPDVLWMVECWDSVDALKAHLASPHMKAFGPSARPLRKSNTFHVMKEMK